MPALLRSRCQPPTTSVALSQASSLTEAREKGERHRCAGLGLGDSGAPPTPGSRPKSVAMPTKLLFQASVIIILIDCHLDNGLDLGLDENGRQETYDS